MNEEEYEIHVDLAPVTDQTSITKEFRIEKCKKCGKTPKIDKDFDFTDYRRYSLHCCGISAGGYSETACIVEWNWKQDNLETIAAK